MYLRVGLNNIFVKNRPFSGHISRAIDRHVAFIYSSLTFKEFLTKTNWNIDPNILNSFDNLIRTDLSHKVNFIDFAKHILISQSVTLANCGCESERF
jgi:hypothetical protein